MIDYGTSASLVQLAGIMAHLSTTEQCARHLPFVVITHEHF